MAKENQPTADASSGGGVLGTYTDTGFSEFLVAPSTSSEFNTARLRLIPIACWRVDDIRFAFDSSFIPAEPSTDPASTPNDIRAELQSLISLVQAHPGCPLSVFGHADPVGNDEYNKLLSGRRAMAVYALLLFNSDSDSALKLWQYIAGKENWGSNQRDVMQQATGLPMSTQDAALMQAYLRKICPPALKLTKADFLGHGADSNGKGDYQGCSEFNPVLLFSKEDQDRFDKAARGDKNDPKNRATILERNAANAPNRRVMVLMFRKGSKIDPAKWPCPASTDGAAGCKKRFWSDGEIRRSVHPPGANRQFQETRDTFACRFYQRISGDSPCHSVTDQCWPANYAAEISTTFGQYSQSIDKNGTVYANLASEKLQYKLYAPVRTGSDITVEVRFKVEPQAGVSAADVSTAKTKLETGVETYWNDRFTLEVDDPVCGKKSFLVKYKAVWVASNQHYTVKVHTTYPREGVTGDVMDVSRTTDDWTYAHEFGHCFGLPDEYSYTADTETVRYFKPDGTLDDPVSAPPFKPRTAPDATIMSSVNNTVRLERHGWHAAIETQKLLRAKLGRAIKCSVK